MVSTCCGTVLAYQDASCVGGVTVVGNHLLVGILVETLFDQDIVVAVNAVDRDPVRTSRFAESRPCAIVGSLSEEVRHHFEREAATLAIRRGSGVVGVEIRTTCTSEPFPRASRIGSIELSTVMPFPVDIGLR